ncbi:SMR family transporter [Nonomuraea sp. NPDC050404]|uniref:DMT family transporter n=1 Tax=Nonomuraea sp. NPDC050404 TaxID=3155783 RepID=UPI0033DB97AD
MMWFMLIAAILVEVAATLALRMASRPDARKGWFVIVVGGYLAAFALMTVALREGMALGVAYGIWVASGVALTALASRVLFKETFTKVMGLGIGLIAGGVLVIELGAVH